jgi:PAS domain S-box-containing protein
VECRELYESVPLGYVTLTPGGVITKANARGAGLLDVPVNELVGLVFADFLESKDATAFAAHLLALFSTGYPQSCEVRLSRQDGSARCVLLESVFTGPDACRSAMIDVTEMKKAEKERELLARAVDHVSEGVALTDGRATVQYLNPAFQKLLGRTQEEIIGGDLSLFPPFVAFEPDAGLSRVLRAGRGWRGTVGRTGPDGTHLELALIVSPVTGEAGAVTHYVIVAQDITDEMRIREHMEQTGKMEVLGTLAGGIAHDFNNMLAVIMGNVELAMEDTAEGLDPSDKLSQAYSAGMRAHDLIRQILTFSRRSGLKREQMHMAPLLKETSRLLRASLPATVEIAVSIRTEHDVVEGTPSRIQQVIMNLATNAAHAMRARGGVMEIVLDTCEFRAGETMPEETMEPGPYVVLTVRDTGVGMDAWVRKRIFEPFFTTKPDGEGAGMGLPVVSGIVKGYRGGITVESEPGAGSRFSVFLPLMKEGRAEERPSGVAVAGGRERVLVVDDEETVVAVISGMLTRLGYSVTGKTKSTEALELFRESPLDFDLVIADQTMPFMTGSELARRMMEKRKGMPVILITGYSEMISPEDALALGIRDFIVKPITKTDLAGTVRRVLDEEKG